MAVKCILTGQTPSVLDGVTENVQTQLNDKVDKITGKGLSTNDYTSTEKTKLSGIETGAQKNTITGVKGSAETTYRTGNVNITATNIGLGNVNNTSDTEKPISTATQTALNGKQATITGAATTITDNNLTANRALISNSSGKVAVSSVTSTELGYLDGVTSNIQTQLNNKLSSAPVTSVNNKTGAVSLGAKDVGAQPTISANGTLKGDGSGNITAANETEVELVSLPNICNPNLLDNWYFGNPVNQRDGKIIQKGVNIYTDSTLKTLIGPAAYACPVVELTSTYAKVQDAKITNSYYYAALGDVVQGYTGAGYTIDRWEMFQAAGTVIIENGGIVIRKTSGEYIQFGEMLETDVWNALIGQTVTMSALTVNGQLATTTQTFTEDGFLQVAAFEGITFHSASNIHLIDLVQVGAESPALLAAKLELGSQQTLAHQENGAWVLNEIPDYGEQLLKCQRYYRSLFKPNVDYAVPATAIAEGVLHLDYALNPTMRTSPVLVGDTHGALRIVAYNMNDLSVAIAEPCDYVDLVTNGTSVDRSTLKIVPNSGVSLVGRYCFTVDTFGISTQFGLSADL